MANNPYVNKVQYGNTTLIDLTSDTVTADKLMQGYTAHDRSGALITGTATGGSGSGAVWQDAQGYVHLDDEGTTPIAVEPLSVTQNGTYTATTGHAYSPVTVNVSGGGGGLEYETGTWTPSEDVASYVIQLANTHTVAPSFYVIADCSNNYSGLTHMPINITFLESYQMVGGIFYRDETTPTYGGVFSQKIGSNANQFSTSLSYFLYPSTSSESSNTNCARYWATETTIKAYSGYNTYPFRAGRTYKWIAVWAPTT